MKNQFTGRSLLGGNPIQITIAGIAGVVINIDDLVLLHRCADRALAIGFSAEICAPEGFGWSRRLVMFKKGDRPDMPQPIRAIYREYGYSPEAATAATFVALPGMGEHSA